MTTSSLHKVRIEVFAWLTKMVGGDGSGKIFFDITFTPGESLETVVRSLSQKHPELHRALWDPDSGQLGASVELIVNDVFMGIDHTLETPVSDGDRITLLPAWDGG